MRFIKDYDKIYFDNAKMGPIYSELHDWRISYEKKLLEKKSVLRDNHEVFFKELKHYISSFFNAEKSEVLLTNSFTSGLQKILYNLNNHTKFLIIKNDYPSIAQSIKNLKFNPIELEYSINIEKAIENGVNKYNPNVLVVSMVQYIDGIKLDFNFIKKLKNKYNNLLIIGDGTQYCGSEKFDFDQSGFDVVIFSGYKWLFSGYGNAVILIKNFYYEFDYNKNDKELINNSIEGGHLDLFSFGSLKFSISLINKQIDYISSETKRLSKIMLGGLKDRKLLDSKIFSRQTHSSIFNIDDKDGKLHSFLLENNIQTSQRGNGCRISLAFYNTENEIKYFFKVLDNFSTRQL